MIGHTRTRGTRLALGGYGPLVALLTTAAVLVAFVPSKAPAQHQQVAADRTASGAEPGVTAQTASVASGPTGPDDPIAAGIAAGPGGTVALASDCEGGDRQTREPYSPPCISFSGDNGGATSMGVTGDTITITFREGDLPSIYQVASQVAEKANIHDTKEDVERTLQAYVEYFNTHFQLYGRKVKLVFYKGQGDQLSEFFGGGGEAANADALRVAQELHGFADASVLTVPYAEALVRQRVISIPPVHMSRKWYQDHAPYAYGVLVDCSRLAESLSDWIATRVAPFPARYAGDPVMRTEPRKIGVIVPEEPWYQECMNEGESLLNQRGIQLAARINYTLDFNRLSSDSAGMIAQMKDRGVTSVACLCDPVLPLFLTTQATQQDYHPEWIVTGSALTDVDLLGQIYDADQWKHAFGISFLSDVFQGVQAESYRAYKAVRDDEPAFIHDVLYYPMLMFFLGVQMAGPDLTPQTFQQGLFSYPPTTGETGKWSFGPDDFTATDDAREIYWDPNGTSPFNGAQGRYATSLNGQRFITGWPQGEATFPIQP